MVIVIIGILVAAAAPSFTHWLKDKRVTDAASTVRDMYRLARARAMGRGAATAVIWESGASVGSPRFVMREAIMGPASTLSPMMPLSSCLQSTFAAADQSSRVVASFNDRAERYKPTETTFRLPTDNTTTLSYAALCFTPRGRVWLRSTAAGAFAPYTGVYRVQFTNADSGMRRQVLLPPTGAARLITRLQ